MLWINLSVMVRAFKKYIGHGNMITLERETFYEEKGIIHDYQYECRRN